MNNIIELEEKLRLAMLTSDVKVLDELISDKLLFTAPTGDVVTKEIDLNAHRSGVQKMTDLELLEQKIQSYDNFAVVTAKMSIKGTFNNFPIDGNYCYTRFWANLDNKWQIVGGHVSKI